ncbi:hypothetical protein EYF80_052738 [Liparis tanakae]|uniref:Uncharacterized protein n=1 Tax=Liparis tanakae TaxID=230148 RepID=A0A4Z2F7H4_9TELE|nr:hypothetical protein EYF80_052738 [Liparis tanakae]
MGTACGTSGLSILAAGPYRRRQPPLGASGVTGASQSRCDKGTGITFPDSHHNNLLRCCHVARKEITEWIKHLASLSASVHLWECERSSEQLSEQQDQSCKRALLCTGQRSYSISKSRWLTVVLSLSSLSSSSTYREKNNDGGKLRHDGQVDV